MDKKQTKEDWLKYYKFVMTCTKCKKMYGSDIKDDHGHCTTCIANLKRLNWSGLRRLPKTGEFEV